MTIFLLDPGHGGMCDDHYMSKGKRSPKIPPGIYEGDFNRKVCAYAESIARGYGVDAIPIVTGPINVPLMARVSFVNSFVQQSSEDVFLISVHANASGALGWSRAKGYTIFHSREAVDKEKAMVQRAQREKEKDLAQRIETSFRSLPIKSRGIKEANFTILSRTKCPSVLVECGFMTNLEDVEFLASEDGQMKIAQQIVLSFFP